MNIIQTEKNIADFFNETFNTSKPLFFGRIGGSDFELVCDYYNDPTVIDDPAWYKSAVRTVKELNGYFDFQNQKENFKKYLDVLIDCYMSCDSLTYCAKMDKHFRFYLKGKSDMPPRFKPFVWKLGETIPMMSYNDFIQPVRPFLKSLDTWATKKTILIISPFSKSIEHQFQFKDKLFLDYKYPDFTLKTYNTNITYNNQNDSKDNLNIVTDNWHEECQRIANEISKIDFDIAFLSCGSYAMFLGQYIKNNLKKQALYFGGSLNLYFNIYGQRFTDLYDQIKLNPKYLIDAVENESIKGIEGGRTYANEGLLAYFGKKKTKKILITGNSGYIGSHLSNILSKNPEYALHGLDKTPPIVSIDQFFKQDISIDTNWNIDTEYDCVIHLAAEVAVGRSVFNPTLYYLTNTLGTLNILKKIKTKNFIFASTGSAAGMNSPYSISKKAAEEIVDQYCKENNIPFTIFRFFNVVGSEGILPTNPDGLMWNLINAKKTGVFTLFGDDYNTKDGSCVRDYTHVNEICYSVIKAITESTNQIENLGHGVGTTVKEMIELFKKINNCNFETIIRPRRHGDLERSVLDNPSVYMCKMYDIKDLLKL